MKYDIHKQPDMQAGYCLALLMVYPLMMLDLLLCPFQRHAGTVPPLDDHRHLDCHTGKKSLDFRATTCQPGINTLNQRRDINNGKGDVDNYIIYLFIYLPDMTYIIKQYTT